MWWNFVGRSHDEIVAFRNAWERGRRFPPVVDRDEKVMEAPAMPTVRLEAASSALGGDDDQCRGHEPGRSAAGDRLPAGTVASRHPSGPGVSWRSRRGLAAQ